MCEKTRIERIQRAMRYNDKSAVSLKDVEWLVEALDRACQIVEDGDAQLPEETAEWFAARKRQREERERREKPVRVGFAGGTRGSGYSPSEYIDQDRGESNRRGDPMAAYDGDPRARW